MNQSLAEDHFKASEYLRAQDLAKGWAILKAERTQNSRRPNLTNTTPTGYGSTGNYPGSTITP